ncbi:MAG: tRNA methyl transferase PRC-barrel domain-containing protein [Candidatus Micrarchaeia archaeon]
MKIAVGYSGGVDSTAAALALQKEGHRVLCVTLDLHERVPVAEAGERARSLGLEWVAVDCRERFARVTEEFVREYSEGRTPNPCLSCNRDIKFGWLLEEARRRGCERLATGHYARLENGRVHKALDARKDQSYAFSLVKKEALPFLLFPMGDKKKNEVKQALDWRGGESQDLCFASSRLSFLRQRLPVKEGAFVYDGKIVGKHEGAWFYCVGERHGFGSKRLFVKAIDVERNEVFLAERKELFCSSLTVRDLNLHGPCPEEVDLIVRHKQETVRARVEGTRVTPLAPLWAPAAGQVAGFYEGDLLVGGGIIDRVEYA